MNCWQKISKILTASLLAILMAIYPLQQQNALAAFGKIGLPGGKASSKLAGKISEASPPEVIQELREALEDYQPQVKILSPKNDEVLDDTTVSIRFQVNDLPLFKDEKLGMGPHLHVFLDDQPYQAVYGTKQPFVLENLTPGTHSLRVFASRPWHESFKNEGAYAQTIFHVYTKTQNNRPNPDLPLVTYSRPQGNYGAEPIMLDFYLTNAPLHLVAQEDREDDIADWRIRVTANGDSFVLDRWQPVYLKGFKPGKNWVQVEYLDEKGNPIQNVFNNTARLITLETGGQDTLSRLVRGELSAAEARGIVDPNYVPPVVKQPEPEPGPESSPQIVPKTAVEPKADRLQPRETTPIPVVPITPRATETKPPLPEKEQQRPTPEVSPRAVESKPAPEPKQPETSRANRWFEKLRQPRPATESQAKQPEKPAVKRPEPATEQAEPQKPVTPKSEPLPPAASKLRIEQKQSPVLSEEKPAEPKPSPQPSIKVEKAKPPEKSSTPRWLDQLKQSFDRSNQSKPVAQPSPPVTPTALPKAATTPAPVIPSQEPERGVAPAPKPAASLKPSQPLPQKSVPAKEPMQGTPKPMPEVTKPKVVPASEAPVEPATGSTSPQTTKESPVKSWFDKLREQRNSRQPSAKTTAPAQSTPSLQEPEAGQPGLKSSPEPTSPPVSPAVEKSQAPTAASRRQQPVKDYYDQIRRPAPSPTVKPLQQEAKAGVPKPGVESAAPSDRLEASQTIPSELTAPGRNRPLVEEPPVKAGLRE